MCSSNDDGEGGACETAVFNEAIPRSAEASDETFLLNALPGWGASITELNGHDDKSKYADNHCPLAQGKGTESDDSGSFLKGLIEHSAFNRRPLPCHPAEFVRLCTANYAKIFQHLYNVYIGSLFYGGETLSSVCSKTDFVLCCRYLLKARIHHVYGNVAGKRTKGHIPLPTDFILPRALAEIINRIGRVTVLNGALIVCPEPVREYAAPDSASADLLYEVVTHDRLRKFSNLVRWLCRLGTVSSGNLKREVEGTAYWLLAVRDGSGEKLASFEAGTALVQSVFSDYSPEDACLAAMVCASHSLSFGGMSRAHWCSPFFSELHAVRSRFALGA